MRVGLIIYGSLETISGGYLYDRKLVDYLQQAGDGVTVISLPWGSYGRHLGDNLSCELANRLNTLQVDVLLQDELNHPSLVVHNKRLTRQAHWPIISIVHHLRSCENRLTWKNKIYGVVERYYFKNVRGFIFNSQTTQQAVGLVLGQAGENIQSRSVVAYPAGDRFSSQMTPHQIELRANAPGPLKLLFLGNIIPRKGLHVLLEALALIPKIDWSLDVVGSPEFDWRYSDRMKEFAARSGQASRVNFLGSLDNERVSQELSQSHVLVVPSSYEGFGIAYLEGMGFGLPAIATSSGAAREIITHGKDGFLIPKGDATALAEIIISLAIDRGRLIAMSLAARQRFLSHPTWEDTGRLIRSFLESMLVIDVQGDM